MAKFKQECIFGIRAIIEAIHQEKEIDKVMLRKGNNGELFQQLFSLIREREIPFQYVPEEVFKPFSGKNHQGVLAEVSPIAYQNILDIVDEVIARGENPLVLVLDRITDVRNLGGITRTAECAGVHAILLPNKNSAKISSDAIKTSAGALYHLPVCREKNLKKTVRELKRRGLMIYAATEKAEQFYTAVDMKGACAIVLGSEDTGIDEDLLVLANEKIKIPQFGKIESLNVSVAAAVIVYEAVRQRN